VNNGIRDIIATETRDLKYTVVAVAGKLKTDIADKAFFSRLLLFIIFRPPSC
jgi:hypothetical protein